jgi:hypothetical protein
MPRPGSHVLHPDFEARNAPVAAGTQTATCVITGPASGPPVFNAGTGMSQPPVGTQHYAGSCRVQRLDDQITTTEGGDQVTTRQYLVAIDWWAYAVKVGDLVTVTDSNDPMLAAGHVTVQRVIRGSLRFERDLYCTSFDD